MAEKNKGGSVLGSTSKYTQEQIDKAIRALDKSEANKEKFKARLAERKATMTPEEKEAAKVAARDRRAKMSPEKKAELKVKMLKARARNVLLAKKAREAGLVISDREVEEFISKR